MFAYINFSNNCNTTILICRHIKNNQSNPTVFRRVANHNAGFGRRLAHGVDGDDVNVVGAVGGLVMYN